MMLKEPANQNTRHNKNPAQCPVLRDAVVNLSEFIDGGWTGVQNNESG